MRPLRTCARRCQHILEPCDSTLTYTSISTERLQNTHELWNGTRNAENGNSRRRITADNPAPKTCQAEECRDARSNGRTGEGSRDGKPHQCGRADPGRPEHERAASLTTRVPLDIFAALGLLVRVHAVEKYMRTHAKKGIIKREERNSTRLCMLFHRAVQDQGRSPPLSE